MREFTLAFAKVGTITISAKNIDEALDAAHDMQKNGIDDESSIEWLREITFEGIV